jgi:hypothetical protein
MVFSLWSKWQALPRVPLGDLFFWRNPARSFEKTFKFRTQLHLRMSQNLKLGGFFFLPRLAKAAVGSAEACSKRLQSRMAHFGNLSTLKIAHSRQRVLPHTQTQYLSGSPHLQMILPKVSRLALLTI